MRLERRSSGPGSFEVLVARDTDAVESLRSDWVNLQANEPAPNINSDIDRYLSVVNSMHDTTAAHVILLRRDERPEAMLIGRLGEEKIRIQVGCRTLFTLSLKALFIIHGGVLGQPNRDAAMGLMTGLNEALNKSEVDVVVFNHLRTDSVFYRLAREQGGVFQRDYFGAVEPHWVMTVPDSMPAFYDSVSKTTRRSLMRAVRGIRENCNGPAEHRCYSNESDLPEMFSAVEHVSAQTYQSALGTGCADSAQERERLRDAARRGWLRMHVLYVSGAPVAFETALEYRGTYFLHAIGYDPGMRQLSPGKALFLMLLEHLCEQGRVERIDFGIGDADYKRVYCDSSWDEATVHFFAKRMRPVLANMVRTASLGTSRGLRHILSKVGLERWVKRRWRDRLIAHSAGKSGSSEKE